MSSQHVGPGTQIWTMRSCRLCNEGTYFIGMTATEYEPKMLHCQHVRTDAATLRPEGTKLQVCCAAHTRTTALPLCIMMLKEELVALPFIVLAWTQHSKFGSEATSSSIVTGMQSMRAVQ